SGQTGPDLVASNLAVTATGPVQSGANITLAWDDANVGSAVATGTWLDHVQIRNAFNQVIADVSVPFDSATEGQIAPGDLRHRQISVRLPDGLPGAGQLTFLVNVDTGNAITEQSGTGQAEFNNTSSITFTSALASYADLRVGGLTVQPPAGWLPGDAI